MDELNTNYSDSSLDTPFESILRSFGIAALAFISVVMVHQFALGIMSILWGYSTHIGFGKVESIPHMFTSWSTPRVLIMYLFPSMGYLTLAFTLMWLLYDSPRLKGGLWLYFFWVMTFIILYVSAQFSVAPFASNQGNGQFDQGVAVLSYWFGLEIYWLVSILVISVLLNLSFGFFALRLLIMFKQRNELTRKSQLHNKFIRENFGYPLLMILPIAIILAYPTTTMFIIIMFAQAILWVFGFMIRFRDYFEGKAGDEGRHASNYIFLGAIVVLVIIIKIFFA